MANEIHIPYANPIWFVDENPNVVSKHLTRYTDDYRFAETQKPWNQFKRYQVKIMKVDTTRLQLFSDMEPITIELYNQDGVKKATFSPSLTMINSYVPGFFLYEFSIDWSTFPVGCYELKIKTPLKTMVSEPISLKDTHYNTLLYKYRNSRYHRDVIYETGIEFEFRVEGSFGFMDPGSSDIVYRDQRYNPTLLSSQPYTAIVVNTGGSLGVPDWVVRLYNEIWSCNDVAIDGKPWAKNSDTKIDLKDVDGYPMRGITMTVQEGINRGSKVITGDLNANKKLVVSYALTNKLFGDTSGVGGTDIIPIVDIE